MTCSQTIKHTCIIVISCVWYAQSNWWVVKETMWNISLSVIIHPVPNHQFQLINHFVDEKSLLVTKNTTATLSETSQVRFERTLSLCGGNAGAAAHEYRGEVQWSGLVSLATIWLGTVSKIDKSVTMSPPVQKSVHHVLFIIKKKNHFPQEF